MSNGLKAYMTKKKKGGMNAIPVNKMKAAKWLKGESMEGEKMHKEMHSSKGKKKSVKKSPKKTFGGY